MVQKKDIRDNVLKLRATLTAEERNRKSQAIFKRICQLKEFEEANTVFVYKDFNSEVETSLFVEELWSRNKDVLFPRVEGSRMTFYSIKSWSQLKSGYFGIMEPDITQGLTTYDIEQVDSQENRKLLVIMPGVAFDHKGNRIGYGGGFYDQFLSELKKRQIPVHTILVAYDIQEVVTTFPEVHDITPDKIITESREMNLCQ